MRCSSFLSNGMLFARQTKKVSLRPAQDRFTEILSAAETDCAAFFFFFFFFFTMWHIFGILLNHTKQQTHFLRCYESIEAEV
jgi:hypothetical protein